MIQKELICINCPMGCNMTVCLENGAVKDVIGYTCKRGKEYAEKECLNPSRIVTTTVKVRNGILPVVSVKTITDIPKNKIWDCIEELKKIAVNAPVSLGDVIVKNIAGTGVDVIATKRVTDKNG